MPLTTLYAHLAANATTQVSSGPCCLETVTINTKGASSNILTLYDGDASTGTVLAIIDTTSSIGTLCHGVNVSRLAAVMATGTAADVTIGFRP